MSKESKLLEQRCFVIEDDESRREYDLYLAQETCGDAEVVAVYVGKIDSQPYLVARYLPEDVYEGALAANLDIWAGMVDMFESLNNK